MTITAFDKANLQALRTEIEAALAAVAAKHGISLKLGGMRYQATSFSVTLEAAAASADGSPTGKEAEAFRSLAEFFGLKANDLGRTFESRNGQHKIVGLRGRSDRAPIITETPDGKRYKWDAAIVATLLKHQDSKAA